MDYERAYKAVLKTATQWIKDGCTDKEKICLECVFPELRESEDERIRKWLLECIENLSDKYFVEANRQDVFAYLEKQKEQKPAEWSEEDEKMLQGIIERGQSQIQWCDTGLRPEQVSWLKSLRRSWRPSEEQIEALRKAINKLAKTDVADSIRLSIMYDNLKKL